MTGVKKQMAKHMRFKFSADEESPAGGANMAGAIFGGRIVEVL